MSSLVTTETEVSVGTVTIDRPEQLNALSTTVMDQLRDALGDLEGDVDVVVLRTAGDVFSAGADLEEIAGSDVSTFEAFQRTSVRAYRCVQSHPQPVVAAVDGLAYGGGCALAVAADMIVAAEDAEFALPEVQLGLVPAGGGVVRRLVANLGLNRATELLTTGEPISAEVARRWGLVNRLASPGETLEVARDLAADVTQNPAPAVGANASIADRSLEMSPAAASELELESSLRLYCRDETRERIQMFLES